MRKKVPIIFALLFAASVFVYFRYRFEPGAGEALSGTGTIEATEYSLGSPLGGLIAEIKVQEGDEVKAGDVVGIIRHADLLAEKKAQEAFLSATDAQIQEAEFKLANSTRNLRRLKSLAGAGSVTVQRVDDTDSATKEANATLLAAKFNRERASHQIESLAEKIDYATVKSPVQGVVTGKHFEKGELAPPGAALATVAELGQVWLKIYIPEAALGRVQIGDEAQVSIDSYPGKTFAGKVSWISPRAEFTPKNVQTTEERLKLVFAVKITIANSEGVFKIGMPADARIRSSKENGKG